MRSFIFGFIILLSLLMLKNPVNLLGQNTKEAPFPFDWQTKSIPGFKIFYDSKDEKNTDQVLKVLFDNYPVIQYEIGFFHRDTFFVFIAPDRQIFRQLIVEQLPNWIGGVAVPGKNLMILKSPKWDRPENNLATTAVHELTHLLLHQAVKKRTIPRWLDEGLAIYYSNDRQYIAASDLSKAILTGSIIPLAHIDDVLNFHAPKAQLAYQESYTAVRYLVETYGTIALQNIIAGLADGTELNEIMVGAIGSNLEDFEAEWQIYIRKNFRWTFIESLDLIWLLIPFLFLTGYLLARIRNRRTLQRWTEEEMRSDEEENQVVPEDFEK